MATCMTRQASRYVLCAVVLISLTVLGYCTWQINDVFHLATPLENWQPIKIEQDTLGFIHSLKSTEPTQENMETSMESDPFSATTNRDTSQNDALTETEGMGYIKLLAESQFNCPEPSLTAIGYPLENFITLTDSNVEDFVFVTAANDVYFMRSLDLIGNIQKILPSRKIIYYDLDVEPKDETLMNISSLCNVEYRRFPFGKFPDHVRKLKEYRFKPLVIHMVLEEYPGVYWVDTSVRFGTDNFTILYNTVLQNGGVVMPQKSGIANGKVTDFDMCKYLPTNITKVSTTVQMCACTYLIYRTESIYKDVFRWLVLCALTKECMAPPNSKKVCNKFHGPHEPWGCHRYDQSAINILLLNKFNFNLSSFEGPRHIQDIMRGSEGKETVQTCLK